jgi:hypothetical protein
MAEKQANIDSLWALGTKIRAYTNAQGRILDDEIEIIANSNAESGIFMSGQTLKSVIRVCCTLIKNRSELATETIRKLPFSYTPSLETTLKENAQQFFPDDLGEFQQRIRDIAQRSGQENLGNWALEEIRNFQREVVAGLLSDIDQYLVTLKHANQLSNIDKLLLIIEIVCVVGTAFLAGLWVADKNGNYEPIIVLFAVGTAGLEIYRRVKQRSRP